MLLFDESPYFLPLSYRSVTLFPMVGHSYSHLMSQTELFGTGSTYLQFLLEIKMKLVEILIFVGYKIRKSRCQIKFNFPQKCQVDKLNRGSSQYTVHETQIISPVKFGHSEEIIGAGQDILKHRNDGQLRDWLMKASGTNQNAGRPLWTPTGQE